MSSRACCTSVLLCRLAYFTVALLARGCLGLREQPLHKEDRLRTDAPPPSTVNPPPSPSAPLGSADDQIDVPRGARSWWQWLLQAQADIERFSYQWMARQETTASRLLCQDDAPMQASALRLIVFDFDETLTIQTYMPMERSFSKDLNWTWSSPKSCPTQLLNMSFELVASSKRRGVMPEAATMSRLERLRLMLQRVSLYERQSVPTRRLAVLTYNENGAIGVLNLLKLAGLDSYFSAIWNAQRKHGVMTVTGLVRQGKEWRQLFASRGVGVHRSKAAILQKVVVDPKQWFTANDAMILEDLRFPEVALVDDRKVNFKGMGAIEDMRRFCEVPRFALEDGAEVGGIGAQSEEDFKTLESFVRFLDEKALYPLFYGFLAFLNFIL
mmetsp:Transcript_87612/g.252997  ORF Transcript_87612/g.252997 Transcript_87612/m.252997 type:complete len:384 (-) Transcript_87612:132-1283(-)